MVVGDKRSTAADSRVGTPPAARAATRSTMAGGILPRRGGFRYGPRCAGRGAREECGFRNFGADVATDPEVFPAPAVESASPAPGRDSDPFIILIILTFAAVGAFDPGVMAQAGASTGRSLPQIPNPPPDTTGRHQHDRLTPRRSL